MPDKKMVIWRDRWPSGNKEELLLRHVAQLRQKELEEEFEQQAPEQGPVETPQLDARIKRLFRQGAERRRSGRTGLLVSKMLMIALIIIIAILAISTVMFAVSPGSRQIINNFDLQWESDHVEISIHDDSDSQSPIPVETAPTEEAPDNEEPANISAEGTEPANAEKDSSYYFFAPTYLPEGFELTNLQYSFGSSILKYKKGDQNISIVIYSSSVNISVDTEHTEYFFDYQVQGYPAITAMWENTTSIFWNDNEHVFHFTAPSSLGIEEMIRIANSITFQEEFFLQYQPLYEQEH